MNTREKAIINGAWKWIEGFMKKYEIEDLVTPNKDLFYKFNTYHSQPNFYSMYKTGDFLYNDEIINYVKNMQDKGKNIHSGASIDISYHKQFREMVIGFRAQSLMFNEDEIIERYNNFYNNYKKLCTMIMRANAERL